MLGNYFTLARISGLIHQQCAGAIISEIYSQHKQQLCIVAESHPVRTIVISCEPSQNSLYIHEGNFRARKNSVDLFSAVPGKRILEVKCDPNDRVVRLRLEDAMTLEGEFFGSRANVLLWKCDPTIPVSSETVLDAFLRKREMISIRRPTSEHNIPPAYLRILHDERSFAEGLHSSAADGRARSLKTILPLLGPTLAKEILIRADANGSGEGEMLTDQETKRIFTETSLIIAELTSDAREGEARVYFDEDVPVCVSPIPLRMYSEHRNESFPDIAAAIRRFVSTEQVSSTFRGKKEEISAWLEKEEKKTDQTRTKIKSELAEHDRSSEYEFFGKLIMSHLHELHKGSKRAIIDDTVSQESPGDSITIPLDPSLSPVANAEKYFAKAKKAKTAIGESAEYLRSLDRRSAMLHMLSGEIADIASAPALKEFCEANKGYLHQVGYMTTKEKETLPPFRLFTVEGGFQVLAGKSSENNDLLTMKFAKPNDLWFHCRGSSGSHVVLKVSSAAGEPSKKAIHQAASIAAYYSKMKNASSVPVAVTEKKFVRKPRGAPAGTVTLEREKVLFVEPKLPIHHHTL